MPNKMQTKQTVNTVSEPWKGAQPYITTGMQGAEGLLQSGSGFNPYQGQMVAEFSPTTEAGLQSIEQTAASTAPLLQTAQQGLMGAMDPSRINGGSPEFLAAQNYQAGQMANDVNRGFSGMGRYGSGAHAGVLGQEIGNFRNVGLANEISRQQQLQMQAFGMAPGMAQAQYMPGQMLAEAGGVRDTRAQNVINADMAKYDTGQMADWNRLNAYNQVVGPYGSMGGTSTQQTQAPRGFPILRGMLGLGLGVLGAMPGSG